MLLSSIRRKDREVSSNATRIYQFSEWLLILAINVKPIYLDLSSGPALTWLDTPLRLFDVSLVSRGESYPWQVLLAGVFLNLITTYEARSKWLSLFLYVVIFPQSIARVKCGDTPENGLLATNVQISAISFLHYSLRYFQPFHSWTPEPDLVIQLLGYILSPTSIYTATLHLQILQLCTALAGPSLNAIESSLLCHALTSFTVYYLATLGEYHEVPMQETFLFSFIYGLLFAVFLASPILARNVRLSKLRHHHRPKNFNTLHFRYAAQVYAIIAFFVLTAVRWFIQSQIKQDPFLFIINYLCQDLVRSALAMYWIGVACTGVIVVIYFWGSKPVGGISGFGNSARRLLQHSRENDFHKISREDNVFFEEEDTASRRAQALDRRRKFFHGLVVVMFLPTLNSRPELSYLALSLAFAAFLFEEVIRITVLPPFGIAIHKFLSGFTDPRDKIGLLVVSHLFLLLGVAGPVWLTMTGAYSSASLSDHRGSLAMLSGVLTLGVGDAAASIVGKKFGRHKWPALKKTVEGTAAFILAMMIGGVVTHLLSSEGSDIQWVSFTIGVLLTGMMEAVSTQNDNLIIPVYMWSMIYRVPSTGSVGAK